MCNAEIAVEVLLTDARGDSVRVRGVLTDGSVVLPVIPGGIKVTMVSIRKI